MCEYALAMSRIMSVDSARFNRPISTAFSDSARASSYYFLEVNIFLLYLWNGWEFEQNIYTQFEEN